MSQAPVHDRSGKQKVRLTAVLLGLVALAFYLGFIGLVMWGGR